jgi:hypothetical protein
MWLAASHAACRSRLVVLGVGASPLTAVAAGVRGAAAAAAGGTAGKSQPPADIPAAVAAIRDLSRGKQASRMEFVAAMMRTARDFSARLETLASRGEYGRALTLLESALDHGVRPTVSDFETVIMALPHFCDADSALRVHRLFRRYGYDPSPTSLRVLLTVYGCEQHSAGLHMAVRDLERMAFPITPSLMGKLMFAYLANGAVDKSVSRHGRAGGRGGGGGGGLVALVHPTHCHGAPPQGP